jgi:integrase
VSTELLTPKTKPTRNKVRYLSLEEEKKLLDMLDPNNTNNRSHYYKRQATKGTTFMQDDYDLVICLLDTGCRKSEIMQMTWEQVDLNECLLKVYRSKTSTETHLYMTDRVYEVLKRRYQSRTTEWVFTNESCTGYRKSVEGIKNVLKKLGLDDVVIHTLRHTFASKALNAGLQLYEVSRMLGHNSLQTTQIYSHLDMKGTAIKTKELLNEINKLG